MSLRNKTEGKHKTPHTITMKRNKNEYNFFFWGECTTENGLKPVWKHWNEKQPEKPTKIYNKPKLPLLDGYIIQYLSEK